LTCDKSSCKYINEKKLHDTNKYYQDVFKHSCKVYSQQDNEKWTEPNFDFSIFHIDAEHEATFKTKIPTQLLDNLADTAEDNFCKLNLTKTNPKRRNYYFYKYLTAYHQTVAQNILINRMTKDKAIEHITTKLIDMHFLARVIIYFDIILNKTPTYCQITEYYKNNAYPEAEKILTSKFNLTF
jgi:hypothetical protein